MSDADALLPVLVAELADDQDRRRIAALAEGRATAFLPLVDAPVDTSLHVLEVMTPGHGEPLLVLAEPVGAPSEQGFPLRLHPYGSPPPTRSMAPPAGPQPTFVPTRRRNTTLTARHTRDLTGALDEPRAKVPENATDLIGREIASGKFLIEALVGEGGMGAVYRARHKQLNKDLAVKVLRESYREDLAFCARFHAEALAISQLDHPNVVRIVDYGQEPDGLLYLAMDFLSGLELGEVLARNPPLPLARMVDIAMQVSAGLGHAHARSIVHRDVKPSNIVLVRGEDDDGGHVVEIAKVCDFGIAGETGSRALVGTPAYMAPEQCLGQEVDGRSDVYSLGVILYEMATGQLPFEDSDTQRLIKKQLGSPPPRPSMIRPVDARFEALILRTLEKSPMARPQSMRELRNALRDLLKPLPDIQLHDVGAGRTARDAPASSKPEPSPIPPPPASTGRIPVSFALVPALAASLAREPVSTLRERLATPERFAAEAQSLAQAMRMLLDQREIAALAHVVAIFRKVAMDMGADPRAELAGRLVRTLQDPGLLLPVAEKVLSDHDETAQNLLSNLGVAAAHALYASRIRAQPTPAIRGRFVSAMRAIGRGAWQLLLQALERNVPNEAPQHDPRLAEDILRSLPVVADDGAGATVAKFLRWGDGPVRRAAIPPLVVLWGDRSRALLLAVLLRDGDEGARGAALKGLRDLRAIDEHVVRKSDEILNDPEGRQSVPNVSLKIAIAEALAEATAEARPLAVALLKRTLANKSVLASLRTRSTTVPPQLLLTLARSLAMLGGQDGGRIVTDLARQAEEPLRTQLLGVTRM